MNMMNLLILRYLIIKPKDSPPHTHCGISLSRSSILPGQPLTVTMICTLTLKWLLYSSCRRVRRCRCNLSSARSISQPTVIASATTVTPLLAMNWAKSSFPAFFLFTSKSKQFKAWLDTFPFTTSCDTSKIHNRFFLFALEDFFLFDFAALLLLW